MTSGVAVVANFSIINLFIRHRARPPSCAALCCDAIFRDVFLFSFCQGVEDLELTELTSEKKEPVRRGFMMEADQKGRSS